MDFATVPLVACIVFSVLVLRFALYQWNRFTYLSRYPWVGTEGKLFFPRSRARAQNLINFKSVIQNAYHQFSLRDQTFILPTPADDLIILPPSHMQWIIDQPDRVLSSILPHAESLQSDYTFPHPSVVRDPMHHHVIKRELTQQLGSLIDHIADEARSAVDEQWPDDEGDFTDITVFPSLTKILARTSNRVLVGLPLCRNDEYLASVAGFARETPLKAAMLKQIPPFLRPLASFLYLSKNREHIRDFTSLVKPEAERRQALAEVTGNSAHVAPNDALQWLVNRSQVVRGSESGSEIIAGRLMALNFAAIHTSSFTVTNALFDLASSNPKDRYIEQLREEARETLAKNGGVWTKAGLMSMHKLDSALKESLRLGSFLGPGMVRKVMLKGGIWTPNGTHCPYGAKVAIATTGIHNDALNYPDSATYDPFRFFNQRLAANGAEKTGEEHTRKAKLRFVSTSATYHPFGHGKHCCPGRFFAACELKLLMAQLLLRYDIEPIETRPKSVWKGLVYLPPMTSSLRVRRRPLASCP